MKNSNVTYTFVTVLLFALVALTACSSSNPMDNPNNKAALAELKKDPFIKEAILTDADVIYVSVDDATKNKTAYAELLCDILKKNNATSGMIKVVKYGSTNDPNADNAYGILLGYAMCK